MFSLSTNSRIIFELFNFNKLMSSLIINVINVVEITKKNINRDIMLRNFSKRLYVFRHSNH